MAVAGTLIPCLLRESAVDIRRAGSVTGDTLYTKLSIEDVRPLDVGPVGIPASVVSFGHPVG